MICGLLGTKPSPEPMLDFLGEIWMKMQTFLRENDFYHGLQNSIKFVPMSRNWQYATVGSGNGLALNRRQAIIWINDGSVYWRIYASPAGLDEFNVDYKCKGFSSFQIIEKHIVTGLISIDLIHKSQNAPVPYPTMLHSE